MLDTIHFGGFNTSLDAFSVGTPVVTLPGEFQRSRHTLAFYRQMGFRDCVAVSPSDYVKIAVRLGTDAPHREEIKARILAARHRLFEDQHVIREYERVFLEMMEQA
jgi:predicted O-linked N-acetylglucosamine transferase (SPINDLY family)